MSRLHYHHVTTPTLLTPLLCIGNGHARMCRISYRSWPPQFLAVGPNVHGAGRTRHFSCRAAIHGQQSIVLPSHFCHSRIVISHCLSVSKNRIFIQESRAIARRTARCCYKFRYVSNFTISR